MEFSLHFPHASSDALPGLTPISHRLFHSPQVDTRMILSSHPAPAGDADSEKTRDSTTAPTDRFCSICQTEIGEDEPLTSCPGCHLPFHEDCWKENRGCSAYGCSHVNVLQQGAEIRIDAIPVGAAYSGGSADGRLVQKPGELPFPWEFLLLAGTVLAAIVSLVLYGVPSLLSGTATVFSLWTARQTNRSTVVLVLGLLISWAGFVLGILSSTLIWQ